MARYDSYVICTSPRSGSTLLCKLLAATGVAGKPESYFHQPSISGWAAYLGLVHDPAAPETEQLKAIFRAALAAGTRDTGVFGLRLQRHSFDFLVRKLALLHPGLPSDAARFRAAFGRTLFVHLTRCDKLEQAVSYVKAEQTGLWHAAPDGTELERLSAPQEPTYDEHEIATCLERMTAYDRHWTQWLTASGIDPLRITYEELSAAPKESLRILLDRLGLDSRAADRVEPGVAKLADEVSRRWVERFLAARGGRQG